MSGSKCKRCIGKKSWCEQCIDNPVYQEMLSKLKSYYMEYEPVCPYGYAGCVNDPAYIQCYHPEWYKELYGEVHPGEAITKNGCWRNYKDNGEFCCYYDEEDK